MHVRPDHLTDDYIICYMCKTWVQQDSEIYPNRAKRRGYADRCKACDKGPMNDRQNAHRLRMKNTLDRLKCKPCEGCGLSWPTYVMDWHHRLGESKLFSIGASHRKTKVLDKILAEIEKCDLLCANCHRIRHHDDGTLGNNQYS